MSVFYLIPYVCQVILAHTCNWNAWTAELILFKLQRQEPCSPSSRSSLFRMQGMKESVNPKDVVSASPVVLARFRSLITVDGVSVTVIAWCSSVKGVLDRAKMNLCSVKFRLGWFSLPWRSYLFIWSVNMQQEHLFQEIN